MIYVTSYKSPDLDGVACSIGYAELVRQKGEVAKPVYYGKQGLETKFFVEKYGELPITHKEGGYVGGDRFVLLDTADPDAVDPEINPGQVLEVFDHRQLVFTEKFANATLHIELVGSCATLVTEEYRKNQLSPTLLTAQLLYGAIVSNTINFKNKVTTDRDKTAAEWLKPIAGITDGFIKEMFDRKSQITPANLQETLLQDFSVKEIGEKRFGIAQLEITDLEKCVRENQEAIEVFLNRMKIEKELDFSLFTGIDIYEGYNILLAVDGESGKMFGEVLNLDLSNGRFRTESIIMRKEIWPKIKAYYES